MAIIETRINGSASLNGYEYYAIVSVNDTINNDNTFTVDIKTYIVNNGTRTDSGGWTKETKIDNVYEMIDYNQRLKTNDVAKTGGITLAINHQGYRVPITMSSIYVVSYMSKSSYTQWDPGYCEVAGWVSMPKVQSIWKDSMQLLSLPNIESAFTLPITKYVGEYYNVVEVRNGNNSILVKAINDAVDGTNVTFTSSELNTIYTMDNNANQLPLIFYMDLKTYTDSSKTTQIGTTQRIKVEAYIVNGEPTATYTIVEQDANVINVLGGSTTDKIIKNASDLLFTITPTASRGATIKSVKVNDTYTTQSGNDYVLNVTNITTGTFNIVLEDSRGLLMTYVITKTLLDYLACKINSWSIERETQVSSNLVLNANMTVWTHLINGGSNSIYVRYSFDGTNWVSIPSNYWTIIVNNVTITNFYINNAISYQNTTPFYIEVYDILSSASDRKTISKGIETFSYGENDLQVNGDIFIADEDGNNLRSLGKIGKLLWAGSFTTGSITISGLSDYSVIGVVLATGVTCFGNLNYGLGGYVGYSEYTTYTSGYRFGVSGNTLSIDANNKGGTNGYNNVAVIEIYGVF